MERSIDPTIYIYIYIYIYIHIYIYIYLYLYLYLLFIYSYVFIYLGILEAPPPRKEETLRAQHVGGELSSSYAGFRVLGHFGMMEGRRNKGSA